jgi:hypothetical protein
MSDAEAVEALCKYQANISAAPTSGLSARLRAVAR